MAATVVGGAFLSATIQIIADRLTSSEFRVFIRNTKFNYSLLEELKTILSALQVVLVDAEQKQFKDLHVKQWLEDLKDAIFDAEDLLNLISYDALRCKVENTSVDQLEYLPSKSINTNSKMEKTCKRLRTFVQLKDILCLQRTVSCRYSHRMPSCSVVNESVVVGRKDDKNTLINMLVSDCGTSRNNNLGVAAILGMGGVGKTTLAQLVYNDEIVQQHFDFKAWVCVSEDFDVVRVTKSLLESVVRNTTSAASKVWESDNLDIQQSNDDAHGKLFSMHELLNDLATVVSGKSCSRFESGDISAKVRYLSYNQQGYDTLPKFPTHFKCLRSFSPIYYWRLHICLSMKVVDDLLSTLKWLRVLSLSQYTDITKLPDSVGNLKQLWYLDHSSTKIHDANLKNKEKIEDLELLWGKHCEDSVKVKVMLDMLQPSMKKLKYLWSSIGNSSYYALAFVYLPICNQLIFSS